MPTDALFDLPAVDWQRLRTLLQQALELPAAQRKPFVDALAGADAAHAPRLHGLLAQAESTSMGQLWNTLPKLAPATPAAAAGDTVGPYRLQRPLGEGGMGSVWLAERTDLLCGRPVALKLPRTADGGTLAARLAQERDILAALEHPNIARLYDAGITAAGQPWLALEYVDGEPIDRHCMRLALPVRARLALLLQVLRAVAHAHTRLVVHRDLKPANVLVDASGQAKLLDFGIAKLLGVDGLCFDSELTQQAGAVLTPGYASPEQVAGAPVGTASDVYMLGVLLFEVLSGARPYTLARTSRAALEEAILAAEPPRPSSMAADAAVRRALRGDLDTIVLKALNKRPEDRYPSVEALAADIERHLGGEPVLARPAGTGYRLRKFIGRHRVGVAASGFAALALCGGSALALWQAQVALAERDRALQVRGFIESVLGDSDPFLAGGGAQTVPDLLRRTAARAQAELASDPELQVQMLRLAGSSLRNHQQDADAGPVLEHAVALARQRLGDRHALTQGVRVDQAYLLRVAGPRDRLRRELDELVRQMARDGAEPLLEFNALRLQSMVAREDGRVADVLAPAQRAARIAQRMPAPNVDERTEAATMLALAYDTLQQPQEALAQAEAAVALLSEADSRGAAHPMSLHVRNIHAHTLHVAGRLAEARRVAEAVLADSTRLLGADSREAGFHWRDLALVLADLGDGETALALARRAVQNFSRWAPPGTWFLPEAREVEGLVLLRLRRTAEALAVLRPVHAELSRIHPPGHPRLLRLRSRLAEALAWEGDLGGAAALLAPERSTGHHLRARARLALQAGDADAAAGQAEAALQQAGAQPVERLQAMALLAEAQGAQGRADAARATAAQALALSQRLQTHDSPLRADLRRLRGATS